LPVKVLVTGKSARPTVGCGRRSRQVRDGTLPDRCDRSAVGKADDSGDGAALSPDLQQEETHSR